MRVAVYLGAGTLVVASVASACIPDERRNFYSGEAGSGGVPESDQNGGTGGDEHLSAGKAGERGTDGSTGTGGSRAGEGGQPETSGGAPSGGTNTAGWGTDPGEAGSANAPSCIHGGVRPCSEGGLSGPCAEGTQSCRIDGSWSTCTVRPMDADTCVEGNDDDCDGEPNEGCGCSTGENRSCADAGLKGNCASGRQVCGADGEWGACSIVPADADTCDPGDDADCDGQSNNNPSCACLDGSMRSCADDDAVGNCANGQQECEQGQWGPCSIEQATRDTCDPGDDANCNGRPNEGCSCAEGDTQSCGPRNEEGELTEEGGCQLGTSTCAGGAWGECVGATYPGTRDCTSSEDNDCDGFPDDYPDDVCVCRADETQACETLHNGTGICRAGTQGCEFGTENATSGWGRCKDFTPPAARNCASSADNDCDGEPDNTVDGAVCKCTVGDTQACGPHPEDGVGLCHAGSQSCVAAADGTSDWGECEGSVGPATETCAANALDENCNGIVNERPPCFGVLQVVAGAYHTCALIPDEAGAQDGTVRCWGDNEYGQLGNGNSPNDSPTPVEVSNLTDVTAIAAMGNHTCALLTEGTVRCWGENKYGKLGDGTTVASRNTPVEVAGLTNVLAVATGGEHSCALLDNQHRSVRCWGHNNNGQLGDNSKTDPTNTVLVFGSDTWAGATSLVLGGSHSCVRLNNGIMQCWGDNQYGQLGDGTETDRTTPTTVTDLSTYASPIVTAGGFHTCAWLSAGSRTEEGTRCWGRNGDGQVGDDTTTNRSDPVIATGLGKATQLEAGLYHTCARMNDGTARCWGDNQYGQLGYGNTEDQHAPVVVQGLSGVAAVTSGRYHTCALMTADKSLRCWGNNEQGQLGDGTLTGTHLPVRVIGP